MPSHFSIQPQRRAPRGGYAECQPHAATRFAILETRTSGHGKGKTTRHKLINAFPTSSEASVYLLRLCRKSAKRKIGSGEPGSRYGESRGKGKVIAESLTLDEYNERKSSNARTNS